MSCFSSWKLSTTEPLTQPPFLSLTLVEWGGQSKVKLVAWKKNSLLIKEKEKDDKDRYKDKNKDKDNNNKNNNGKGNKN